ncbi:hypothetical protein PoB_000232100 [Plakobranchus ocellatus]|uniref:Uncharacterized protein n=1 Tax=Plakobranchus ocellatus TaxID=259542 RepID=A0AAV3X940_9GAST|nr:hypothetical protein PoB_000232100 [Plakobranchus ocellatus]
MGEDEDGAIAVEEDLGQGEVILPDGTVPLNPWVLSEEEDHRLCGMEKIATACTVTKEAGNHRRRNRNRRRKHEEKSGFYQARDPPQRSSEKTTESDVNTSMDDQARQKAKTGNGRGRGRGRRPWQWIDYPHRSYGPSETMGAFTQVGPSTMLSGENSYSMHSNQSLDQK